jgi:hypothetical protein
MVTMAAMLAASAFASPEPVVPELDREHAVRINRNWRGLGIGYDNGLWGSGFAQGVKLDVPFGPRVGQFLGVRLRGVMVHPHGGPGPVGFGGAELFGRGPVLAGVVRVYGGGGAWYGGVLGGDEEATLAGGGHSGVEVLLNPRMSFSFEVGGQSPVDPGARTAGASVMAGSTVYLGGLGRR